MARRQSVELARGVLAEMFPQQPTVAQVSEEDIKRIAEQVINAQAEQTVNDVTSSFERALRAHLTGLGVL